MTSGFTTLSTRFLEDPLILHAASCCPTMDVAVLSNPPNSGSDASLHLYRLSGGATALTSNEAGSSESKLASSSSKVWSTTVQDSPVLAAAPPAAHSGHETVGKGKGRGRSSKTGQAQIPVTETYVQPRLAETTAWSPDGQLLAFASSTSNLRLYSIHDGKPVADEVDLPSSSKDAATSLYLLSWEECLPPDRRVKRELITAEELEMRLARLPDLKKEDDTKPKKTNTFSNPFLPGFAKPYVPTVPFTLPSFPSLTPISPFSPNYPEQISEDDSDYLQNNDEEYAELRRLAENPTLLLAGDDQGNLHFLMGGAISLGSISLGKNTDIISALVSHTTTKPKTALFRDDHHTLALSLLISIPPASVQSSNLPPEILSSLPSSRKSFPPQTQIVSRVLVDIPQFPSPELTLLSRASSNIKNLLSHAYEAIDEARKTLEEARELGGKWLDRLRDDDCKMLPELQLLLLLLTGKPPNTNMHDYLASKNTERNLERWETATLKAVIKLRDAAYQSITPVCERILIWLDQLRGWAAWHRRFGHLNLQKSLIEECVPILKLLMLTAAKLEALALEEELGFRDFCGWLKFELERISGIEAHSDSRPFPKHDVLAVMTYIKTKLTNSPLDSLVRVEAEKDANHYIPAFSTWVKAQLEATEFENVKNQGKAKLAGILEKLKVQESRFDTVDGRGEAEQDMQVEDLENELKEEDKGFKLEEERLFTDPPVFVPPSPPPAVQPTPRRKSATAVLPPQPVSTTPIVPTELPIPFYFSELTKRLSSLFERSFHSVSDRVAIKHVNRVIAWQPADREEDDSMTALGLARDPTKITSRVVRTAMADGSETVDHWIACETPPETLLDGSEKEAFWIIRVTEDGATHAAALALKTAEEAKLQILDIEFYDDQEVALLLRLPVTDSRHSKHALATVRFQDLELVEVADGTITFAQHTDLPPIPFARYHRFESSFEPLQFALNGRKGRRVGCVLGNLGKVLEVLDMETEEADEADAGVNAEEEEELGQDMQIPDFVQDDDEEQGARPNGTLNKFDEDGDESEDMDL